METSSELGCIFKSVPAGFISTILNLCPPTITGDESSISSLGDISPLSDRCHRSENSPSRFRSIKHTVSPDIVNKGLFLDLGLKIIPYDLSPMRICPLRYSLIRAYM